MRNKNIFAKLFPIGDSQVLVTLETDEDENTIIVQKTIIQKTLVQTQSTFFVEDRGCEEFENYNQANAESFFEGFRNLLD